jgi:hypothetical protein
MGFIWLVLFLLLCCVVECCLILLGFALLVWGGLVTLDSLGR